MGWEWLERVTSGTRWILRRLTDLTEFLFQAILDFLVEDLCAICGERSTPPGAVSVHEDGFPTAGPIAHVAECLLCPVAQRTLPGLTIRNHSVCRSCAQTFDPARDRSLLGVVVATGGILTVVGELFDGAGRVAPSGDWKHPLRSCIVAPGTEIPIVAAFMTSSNVLKLIHLMKFSGYDALTQPMAMALVAAYDAFGRGLGRQAVVAAVPRTVQQRRRQGQDPTARLASRFGEAVEVPALLNVLVKTRRTQRQSQTPAEGRAANVRGAFSCRSERVVGHPVILVDDLVTTGATAAACAAELLAAGADGVEVLCFARAL